jgi:AcrR family transcriptional regulator
MASRSTKSIVDGRRAAPPSVESLPLEQRERRDRIVSAAVALMASEDYERIQVKDVADAAGVALGTLYRYFASKDHLFACARASWAGGFGEDMISGGPGRAPDRVKALFRRSVRAFERQPHVWGALHTLQASNDPYTVEAYRTFSQHQQAAYVGALARVPEERRADIIAVMTAVLAQNLREWHLGHQPIASVYDTIDRAVDLIFPR